MGSCTSRIKKKNKGDSTDDTNTNTKVDEDVTYASIDHGTAKGSRRTRATTVDDCDYATVYVPPALLPRPESDSSSKGECEDDYVPMG
ncbi:uncharacterized protein si:ch211-214p13.7 [Notolabrus celidotus]|uniref:uncharacterized protein si:ch211-214p13.7 n=1 Tax=Notolabrus celidotus TaxID=1203425 RepID=UPI00148F49F8|nr:uncharacterized protein si:ch211-214p13.7 [Notolabrus celidotus]